MKPPVQHCTHPDCGKALPHNPRRKGTMCRSHAALVTNQNPERNAKIAATLKKQHQQPFFTSDRARKIGAKIRQRLRDDPEFLRKYQEHGRAVGLKHGGQNVCEPEVWGRAIRKSREMRLAHIPEAYREQYVELGRQSRLPAVERVRMIQDQIERDNERLRARIEREAHV